MSSRLKWIACGLVFLATLLNYLDRQTIAVSASRLAGELRLTDGDLGKLFFGFLFAYGLAQLFVGAVLDRYRLVAAYAVAVTAWSLVGAASAFTTGFASLFAVRLLLGVCESPNWPLALRVVARVFPPAQRPLAIGIFQSGTSIGALVAPPIIIWLTHTWNWRVAFVACGVVGFGWTALWLAASRGALGAALHAPVAPPPSAAAKQPANVREILRSRSFWGLFAASSFINPLQYFYTTWLPRYFEEYAGVSFGTDLMARLVLVYLALDVGLWLGGGLVAALAARFGVRMARLGIAALGTVAMMAVPLVAHLGSLNAITALICAATFGLGCFLVNYLAFVTEVSATRVSTAAGLLGGAGSLAGAGFMLLVGGTVERAQSFNLAFLMAGAMPLLAFAGLWFAAREHPAEAVGA